MKAAAFSITCAMVLALAATVIAIAGQTVVVKITASGGVYSYSAGASQHAVPANILKEYQSTNRKPPSLALKPGDTLVIQNASSTYCKPFSLAPGNKFESGKKGIAPGGSISVTVKNTGRKPLIMTIRDDIHSRTVPLVVVVLSSKDEKEESKATFTGTWDTSYGKMTLTQSGNQVNGSYDYKGGSTIEGAIDATSGMLHFKWQEPTIDGVPGRHGIGKFKLSSDGNSFIGDWNYILSDGKSIGNGGGWSGKRVK